MRLPRWLRRRAADPPGPDLDWVPEWVANVREFIDVRVEDRVLIQRPNRAVKLNEQGARILRRLLDGEPLAAILAGFRRTPQAWRDTERFLLDVRRLLKDLSPDMRIEEACDGYEAGIKIGSLHPDLIIMDVMMPRVDGISLCKSIRDNPETANIKVLAITAFPEQDNVKKMYDAGADLCLIKPLQFEHFRLEVIRLLNERTPAASAGH